MRITQEEREQAVLDDLEAGFPGFGGDSILWTKVPRGQDPPDFVGVGRSGRRVGLELTEWLNGAQMTAAKVRESQRDQVRRILASDWEAEYRPRNFRGAFVIIGSERISRAEESALRQQFYAHAAEVDRTWPTNPDRTGNSLFTAEFPGYPLLGKYLNVRYIGGEPHGLCWIHTQGDGGAYDPAAAVDALTAAINNKLVGYSTPEQDARLKAGHLDELDLLVHGGFNAFAYNTPSEPLSLQDIARRGAEFYMAHSKRHVFDRVWFFDSLDSADEFNQLLGISPALSRVRWLAELWPDFRIY